MEEECKNECVRKLINEERKARKKRKRERDAKCRKEEKGWRPMNEKWKK